jgi:hypothetical protein
MITGNKVAVTQKQTGKIKPNFQILENMYLGRFHK